MSPARAHFRDLLELDDFPEDLLSATQHKLQASVDSHLHATLFQGCAVRDKARLTTIAAPRASAWLWAIPNSNLGLAMQRHEFVAATRYWLGCPRFDHTPVRCTCGALVDRYGDHLLGCSCGNLRIGRHDALCEVVYHALRQDCGAVRREQRVAGDSLHRPADLYHPDFREGRPGYFDVTVRQSLQPCFLARASVTAGMAAAAGEQSKDGSHRARVEDAGGLFYPLVVESLGLWSESSHDLLRQIAARAAVHSGLPLSRASTNLYQQLSIKLWQFNAKMLLSRMQLGGCGSPMWDLAA